MRIIKLRRLEIENFKCFKHKIVEFPDRATVRGRNAIGKSTLYGAVLWLLFDKNAAGDSATGIRPHDADGNDIHFIDITVAGTFDVDGREITIKKTQSENWVKPRGSQDSVFKGNVNTFEINSIPKKQADFKAYISENFCDEETFLSCTNAQSFFRLDTKKRRAKLLQLAGTITDEDVIATDTAFAVLKEDLKDGTVDELIARSKSSIKRLNDTLKTLPARIDEQEKSKVDIDAAEMELEKSCIMEKMESVEKRKTDLSEQYKKYQAAGDRALQIKFEMGNLRRIATEQLAKERRDVEDAIRLAETEDGRIATFLRNAGSLGEHKASHIQAVERQIEEQETLWNAAQNRVFDNSSLVCPYCGQEYPQDKKDALRAEFEAHKADELKSIEEKGSSLRTQIEQLKAEGEATQSEIDKYRKQLADNAEDIKTLKMQLAEMPTEADAAKTGRYKELAIQLEQEESFAAQGNDIGTARGDIDSELVELRADLERVNAELAKVQRNIDIDERIAELQEEQRTTAQKVADQERMLDLFERFNRAKMNYLTEKINSQFSMVRWKLFQEQINGGYQDVCYALVDGTNVERGLNDSDSLLANIDILTTFQRMNGLQLPLFLDRGESINQSRIPQTDCQLIVLTVSEDAEMVVA